MADELTKPNQVSPIINSAQGGSKDQMKMAGTQAAKQGAGIGEYFGVKGNVHEVPATPTATVEATRAPTEKSRILEKGLETEAARLEAEKIRAQDTIANTAILNKSGSLGAAMQGSINAKIAAAFKAQQDALGGTTGVQADVLGAEAFGTGIMTEEQNALSDAFNAGTEKDIEKLKAAGIKFNPVTGRAINEASSYKTITTSTDEVAIKDAIADIAFSRGKLDVNGKVSLTVDDIEDIFGEGEDKLAAIIALAIPDEIRIFDESGGSSLIADMGYTDSEIVDLRKLLDLNDEDTVQTFQAKVQKYRDSTFADILRLEAQLFDPAISAGEKAYVRERLRDMGYIGALGNRANVESIARMVDAADEKITFGDTEYETLEDLLNDKTMSGIINRYLDSDPEGREEMDLPKSLSDMIDSNEELFKAAMFEVTGEVEEFEAIQDKVAKIKELDWEADTAAAYGVDITKAYQSEMPAGALIDFLTSKDTPKTAKVTISGIADKAAKAGKSVADNFKGLSETEWKELSEDKAKEETYVGVVNQAGTVKKLIASNIADDINTFDDELGVMETVMGLPTGSLVATINNLTKLKDLGVTLTTKEQAALDLIAKYYSGGMETMLAKMDAELNTATQSVSGALASALHTVSNTAKDTTALLAGKTDSINYLSQVKKGEIKIDPTSDTALNEIKAHIGKLGLYTAAQLEDPKTFKEALGKFDIVIPEVQAAIDNAINKEGLEWTKDVEGFKGTTDIADFANRVEAMGGIGRAGATFEEYNTIKKTLADFASAPEKDLTEAQKAAGMKPEKDLTEAQKAAGIKLYQMVVANPQPLTWTEAIHSIRKGLVYPIRELAFDKPLTGFEMLFNKTSSGKYMLKNIDKLPVKELKDIYQDFARLIHTTAPMIPNINTKAGMDALDAYIEGAAAVGVAVYNPKAATYRASTWIKDFENKLQRTFPNIKVAGKPTLTFLMQLEAEYNKLKAKGVKDPKINNVSFETFKQIKKEWTSHAGG